MTEAPALEEETQTEGWIAQATTPIDTLLQEIQDLLALTNTRDIFTSNDIQDRMLDMHNTATKIAPKIPKAPHDQN